MRIELKNYLLSLEEAILDESLEIKMYQRIGDILKDSKLGYVDFPKLSEKEKAEYCACSLTGQNTSQHASLYYAPMFSFVNKDEEKYVNIDPLSVTPEIIEIWKKRSEETNNPFLAFKYADLVIDFCIRLKIKNNAYPQLVALIIDNTIKICEHEIKDKECISYSFTRKLLRAYNLAKSTKVNPKIIKLENFIVNNSHPSYWLDIFDRFFLNSHHLIPNAQSLLEKIKNGAILKTDFDFMEKLCSYYRQVEAEKLPKIFEEFEENMHNNPNFKSNHILKMNYLSKLNQLCLKYSNLGKEYLHINEIFKHKAENLKKEMSSYSIDDYKFIKISASSKIEKEKLERYVQWFFEKQYSNEKENLRSIFFKIVANFLIDKEKDKLEFESLQSKNSFQALCNRILVDEQGTITAASPLYDDKLIKYCADNLFYVAPILESVLEKFKQEFTINFICENMILSPVFDKEEDGNFLLHGLKAFWAGDYLTASLTFSPLIESCFRNFVKISGGNFITENDFNGYEYKTLGALFDDEKINEVFTYFKRDVAFYFRLVLTEKLGWNLRNTIAHGVNKRILFDRRYADRLLHILICLSVLS